MEVRRSATKHGIEPEDSIVAATSGCAFHAPLDDENPQRELRLGFDTSMRLLELVVLLWDDGTETIIYSMKARKQYRSLLG
nr:toxin [Corynebacterium glaucum]